MKSCLLIALLTVTGLALSLADGGPAAQGGTDEQVFAPRGCVAPKVEPRKIVIACGDGTSQLVSLRWTRFGGERARAQGRLRVNDCMPYCAVGTIHYYRAKIRLKGVRRKSCGGRVVRLYTRYGLKFLNDAPDHARAYRRGSLYCVP